MKLGLKILLLYIIIGLLISGVVSGFLWERLSHDERDVINAESQRKLELIDFALTIFLEEAERDVSALAANDLVRTRDDSAFTNFLTADVGTFTYDYTDVELQIIDVFNQYRITHPYVNSVYMGRENGSFVRSHPRTLPTRYDPRERPWYALALENPGIVTRTAPYRSVTTSDANIGIVTTLLDENGELYGVVGMDITLKQLTEYITGYDVGYDSELLLVDNEGTVIAFSKKNFLFLDVGLIIGEQAEVMMSEESGILDMDDSTVCFITSPMLGWKLVTITPNSAITSRVRERMIIPIGGLFVALALLSTLTFVGLDRFIIKPLEGLKAVTQNIANTGDLSHRVDVKTKDEIGSLADSFNRMIQALDDEKSSLKTSDAQNRAMLNAPVETIALIKPDGTLLKINASGAERFGLLSEDAQGRDYFSLLPPELSDVREKQVKQVLLTGEPAFFEGRSSHGYIANSIYPIREEESGEIVSLAIFASDITERKLAEEKINQLNAELEQRVIERTAQLAGKTQELENFTYTVSHDLKAPLRGIDGYSRMLYEDYHDRLEGEGQRFLNNIRQSVSRMNQMIEDLLSYSRFDRQELHSEPINPQTLIQDMLSVYAEEAQRRGITFKTDLPNASVSADRNGLVAALRNLIDNAVKFTRETSHPMIEITGQETKESLIIAVKDNGIGLDMKYQEKIFKLFNRLHTDDEYNGTGIGLAIVHKAMERMGGRVWVESEEGKGAAFFLEIPK